MDETKEQQVSFQDYIKILYRGRWIVLFSFIIVAAVTTYFTFTTQPVYEASGLVMLKEEGTVKKQVFEMSGFMQQETRINNQVELLKSDTLAKEVIKRLKQSPYADSLWILGKRKKEDQFQIKEKLLSLIQFGKNTHSLKSDSVSSADLAERFRKNAITVIPKRNTDMIEMKAQALSPFEAAFVVNTWMQSYRDMDIRESQGEVTAVRQFLEDKLKGVQETLSESENSLKTYKEKNKVTELTAETEQMIKQAADFESQYQAAKTELEANEKRLEYIKSQLDVNKRALLDEATSMSSPVIQELQKQMATLMADRAAYEQQLKGAGYPTQNDTKLQGMERRLKGIQESILSETKKLVSSGAINPLNMSESLLNSVLQIETENKSLKAKTDALGKIVQRYNLSMNTLPEKTLKLAQLSREAQVNNTIFMMLREKYEENRIAEAGQIGGVRIVDRAKPPKFPIKPKKKMNLLLGMLVGLGLGIGMTFVREYMDTSLKSIEDVERLGFPVLGSIPFITSARVSRHLRDKNGELLRIESRLITHFAPKSPISEAYRTLRTNIQYARADHHIKTVLVTSSGMGEGKSTSVANLAITFAQMGAKTLLVDTDLRRPVLHGIFNYPRNEGLTNVLLGRLTMNEAIKTTKIENLYLITSGILPPNPSELLSSHAMEKFITETGSKFDIALFDTPPIIAVTDAAVLATKLDGCILVVRSGKTNRDALLRSKVLLDNVKANLFGILVNGVTVERMYGSYYYYYYSSEGKDKK